MSLDRANEAPCLSNGVSGGEGIGLVFGGRLYEVRFVTLRLRNNDVNMLSAWRQTSLDIVTLSTRHQCFYVFDITFLYRACHSVTNPKTDLSDYIQGEYISAVLLLLNKNSRFYIINEIR